MRVITLDIETMAHKSWHWRLFNENIGTNQLIEPTYMLSYAWKEGKSKTQYRDVHDDDFYTTLAEVLDSADLLITFNGDKFDMPHVRRELLLAGCKPPKPCASVDLYKVVRKEFNFASNRLDFVAGEVLGERKLDTGGFDLWKEFVNGCPKAQRLMERYNKRDVDVTWKLYHALRPWIRNHPFVGSGDERIDDYDVQYECPCCETKQYGGSHARRTRCFAIRQVQCDGCGHWYDGKRKKLT